MKAENWPAAADILHEGAVALLRAGQGGSGGDLACLLVEVYTKARWKVEGERKGSVFLFFFLEGRVEGRGKEKDFGILGCQGN